MRRFITGLVAIGLMAAGLPVALLTASASAATASPHARTIAAPASGPAVLASAAPGQHAQTAHVVIRNGHLAVAIALRPGSHAVSHAVPLSARSYSPQAAASSSPEVQVRVGPNNCGGFNGQVVTGNTPFPYDTPWVQVYGIVWDDCGPYIYPSTVYVYVNYHCFLCHNPVNYSVGSVYDGGPGGVSTGLNSGQQDTPSGFDAAGIKVTACMESAYGWQCGAGKGV
jgi:hypothetical protein